MQYIYIHLHRMCIQKCFRLSQHRMQFNHFHSVISFDHFCSFYFYEILFYFSYNKIKFIPHDNLSCIFQSSIYCFPICLYPIQFIFFAILSFSLFLIFCLFFFISQLFLFFMYIDSITHILWINLAQTESS